MAKKKQPAKPKKPLAKLDETGIRSGTDRRAEKKPVADDRRKNKRRRQIDPTTCEREYTSVEIEFMHALDEYKHASGRMFPTCSEILEVIHNLGYRQVAEPQEIYNPDSQTESLDEESLDSIEEEQLI